ncbi:translocation and assembly module lipoprotein TamL [Runella slithyformis]|uniref:Surface antigen (D15) n=1 Tax=Runella slithyformis (strain ATCC 29530 / DSM 19594 / LMG 11500 / NCIMB 11436 / LSU 4) TaxID=761193 RepID=A0A7U3ZNI6_RUNSL|nr:surface antigen (D15) [Runella slithyformis]AEI50432.1 surface antigen (D15) [Runella slithyformis DSM 19594]
MSRKAFFVVLKKVYPLTGGFSRSSNNKDTLGYHTTRHYTRRFPLLSFLFLSGFLSLFWACSRKSTPKKDEYLLGNQLFKGNSAVKTEALEALLPQRPNKRFLGIPGATVSLWIYQGFDKRYDREAQRVRFDSLNRDYERRFTIYADNSRKLSALRRKYNRKANKYRLRVEEGHWGMRTLGEAPVYFEEKNVRANVLKIKGYLVNEGYRDANVEFLTDTIFGRVRITYNIEEGLPHILREVDVLTHKDPEIDSLLSKAKAESYVKSGKNFRYSDVISEISRIEQLMQNNGYFGFDRNYLRPVQSALGKRNGGFLIDTTGHNAATDSLFHIVDVKGLQVNYPRNQERHIRYTFNPVGFRVESLPGDPPSLTNDTTVYRGIHYSFTPKHYYSPRVLNDKILIRPGNLYRKIDWDETYRQLSVLDQFQFINIDTDTTNGYIKTLIRVIPHDKFQVTGEGGVNVVQNLPGPFLNGTFRVRNIFGRLENFEVSLRGALDANFGLNSKNTQLVRTLEMGANTALIFPRFLFPGKIAAGFNRKTPRTIVSLGYNYTNRDFLGSDPDFIRSGFQASLRYNWKKSEYEYLSLTAVDLSVLQSKQSREFGKLLDSLYQYGGNPLKFSFQSAVISGVSFSYVFNNNIIGQNRRAHYLRLFAESGGTALSLLESRKETLGLQGFELYKFFKANVEYRRYKPLGPKSTLVYRLNSGFIFNYNDRRVAPYEKSLTGGGSNSLRAWPPRRLGLGAAYPNVDLQTGSPIFRNGETTTLKPGVTQYSGYEYRFEQLGDVLMEANAELRGHLFRFVGDVNYALFVDVGNVWRLRLDKGTSPNQNTLNGVFELNRFYKEFAVGTGVGLRYDLSYFIFRLDMGIKVYDPSRRFAVTNALGETTAIDERYLLPKFSFRRSSPNYPVFNIGIGYPF